MEKTLLQQALEAVEKMNNGLIPEDLSRGFFSIEATHGSNFVINYGDINGKISFCNQHDLQGGSGPIESVHQRIADIWKRRIQLPISKIKTEPYQVTPETRELIDATVDFAEAMKKRLVRKDSQGWAGWKNYTTSDIITEIYNRLKRMERDENTVDIGIANFALIHWMNRNREGVISDLGKDFVESPTTVKTLTTHYLKDKPYRIISEGKIKLEGILYALGEQIGKQFLTLEQFHLLRSQWIDVVVYEALYQNPDGRIWVRTRDEFYRKFKTQEELDAEKPKEVIEEKAPLANPNFRTEQPQDGMYLGETDYTTNLFKQKEETDDNS